MARVRRGLGDISQYTPDQIQEAIDILATYQNNGDEQLRADRAWLMANYASLSSAGVAAANDALAKETAALNTITQALYQARAVTGLGSYRRLGSLGVLPVALVYAIWAAIGIGIVVAAIAALTAAAAAFQYSKGQRAVSESQGAVNQAVAQAVASGKMTADQAQQVLSSVNPKPPGGPSISTAAVVLGAFALAGVVIASQ